MGKTTKAFMFFGVLLVLLMGGRAIVKVLNPADDKTMIRQALADSIKASKEGRPGGVMEKLSANLKFNGQNEGGNETQIARYIRDSKPDVEVENMDPVISGDEATIESPVNLSMGIVGQRHLKDVTLTFHKESGREWLIIPTKVWRLSEVTVPDTAVADLIQQ